MTTRTVVRAGPFPAYIAETATRTAVVGTSYVRETSIPDASRTVAAFFRPAPAYVVESAVRTAVVGASYLRESVVPAGPPPAVASPRSWLYKKWLLSRLFTQAVSTAGGGGGGGTFSISVSARRTSGVAPFNVHFNALASTHTTESDIFRKVWFEWDFGETTGVGVAAWAYGIQNRTRNTAHGPVTAHLYEVPGSYTATCLAYYGGVVVGTTTVPITVTDPAVVYSGKTMQYANAGSASGTQVITSSWDTVIASIVSKGDGWRHRFNRGDTWLMSTDPSEVTNNIATSDCLFDTYGSGAKPVLGLTGASAASGAARAPWTFGHQSSIAKRNIISDFTIDGSTSTNDFECAGVDVFTATDLTIVRMTAKTCQMVYRARDLGDKYNVNLGTQTHSLSDGLSLWDCDLLSPKDTTTALSPPYAAFMQANYYSIQGCNFDLDAGNNSSRSHIIRQIHGYKGVIANNKLRGAGQGRHCIKLHSETQLDVETGFAGQTWALSIFGPSSPSGGKTDYIWVADNEITGTYTICPMSISPPSTTGDDSGTRIYHVGTVGNLFSSGPNSALQLFILYDAQSGLIANNLFALTTGSAGRHLIIHTGTRSPIDGGSDGVDVLPGDDLLVENNSAYIADSHTGVAMFLSVQNISTNTVSKNNVLWTPNDSSATFASGDSTTAGVAITSVSYASSNDSSNTQIRQATAPFVSSTPATKANFALAVGSYALNAGTYNNLQKDINGLLRSITVPDMGAIEQ